jgi:hypothetical protein
MNYLPAELLESRIAPAALLPGGKSMTYTDVDGDLVKVTITKGTLAEADFTFNNAFGTAGSQQLQVVNFGADLDKAGTNLIFTVVRKGTGDGFAHVGAITATGVDLGVVTVKGDLGKVVSGDADATSVGLVALTVQSLGEQGNTTQGGVGSITSAIDGGVKSILVKGNVAGAEFNVFRAGATVGSGTLGSIFVGGSIIGGSTGFTGQIFTADHLLKATVKGDLRGGSGNASGQLSIGGKANSIFIGGSVLGGAGGVMGDFFNGSGGIITGRNGTDSPTTSIFIGGEVVGGAGFASGSIQSGISAESGPVKSIIIKGSVQSGSGGQSGRIFVTDSVGTLTIGGSLLGGSGNFNVNEDGRGQIFIEGSIKTLKVVGDIRGGTGISGGRIALQNGSVGSFTVGGSMVAGTGENGVGLEAENIGPVKIGRDVDGRAFTTGTIPGISARTGNLASITIGGSMFSANISAGQQMGPVTIKGSVVGEFGDAARISALGQTVQSAKADVAIKSIKIGGNVQFVQIFAGFDLNSGAPAINPDAQIGPVTVGGDWLASSIVAGVVVGADSKFGTLDDVKIVNGPNSAAINSRIASIVIKGQAVGSLPGLSNVDHFGFVAQEIGALSIGGVKFALTPGIAVRDVIELSPFTADLTVREVAI